MLDNNGFTRKDFDDWKEDYTTKFQQMYGSDIDTSDLSYDGATINILAYFATQNEELAESIYLSGFVSQATGVSLDKLANNVGLSRNPAQQAMALLSFTGTAGNEVAEGSLFETPQGIQFMLIDAVELDHDGNGSGEAVSVLALDSTNVGAEQITVITEPVEELYTVTNPEEASGGATLENDQSLRERIMLSYQSQNNGTLNGIVSAIRSVTAVRDASVRVNDTMTTNAAGDPPKSVHAFVLGGNSTDIANAIFKYLPIGVQTVGDQAVSVTDIGGYSHDIHFDTATNVPVEIALTLITTDAFPIDGLVLVKNKAKEYVDGLKLGQQVNYSYFYKFVYEIPGVVVDSLLIGRKGTTLTSSNIDIDLLEVASLQLSDIEVS